MPAVSRSLFCLILLCSLAGCDKRSGEAIVLSKEHIDAAPPPSSASPSPSQTATEGAPASSEGNDGSLRPMREDEIAVDQYVMKKVDRGTARDPRATANELWLIKVRMNDGRTFNVPAKPTQFARLKEGDRVPITYHVGKYTGTVWAAEIDGD